MESETPRDTGIFANIEHLFSLHAILDALLRFWKVVFCCILLGGLAGFVVTKFFIPKVYTASTVLFAWNNDAGRDESRRFTPSEIAIGGMLVNDYRRLLTSRKVQDAVLKAGRGELPQYHELDDDDLMKKFPSKRTAGSSDAGVSPEEEEPAAPAAGKPRKIYWTGMPDKFNRYSVRADFERNTRILTISATSRNPEVAQFVANQSAAEFRRLVAKDLSLQNVQMIDEASLPVFYSRPILVRNVLAGLFLGVVLGVLIAVALTFIDRTIKTPEQAETLLGKPVLGSIPLVGHSQVRNDRKAVLLCDDPESHAVEAFRMLRTNLHYLLPVKKDDRGRVIMATSSVSNEGKSNCIAALAAITGQSEKKVLLIDGDLRKPSVHRIFHLSRSCGLVSILAGDADFDQAVVHCRNGELDILPSGPTSLNPSELLMSSRFRELIEALRERYDYIFIDAPPSLLVADPLVIGQIADGAIFVLAGNETKTEIIMKARRQIDSAGVKILGLLLNKFDHRRAGYSYGYTYKHSYYSYGDQCGKSAGSEDEEETAS